MFKYFNFINYIDFVPLAI